MFFSKNLFKIRYRNCSSFTSAVPHSWIQPTCSTGEFTLEGKTIQLPQSFSALLDTIRNEYVLSAEDLKNLQLKYMDSDNDLIILGNEEDFKMFAELVDKKEAKTVLIDLTEQSKIIRIITLNKY